MERRIVYRGLRTPDGTLIETKYGHDYQTHIDKNGETYMIDGGPEEYGRYSINTVPGELITLFSDDSYDQIRQYVRWGRNFDKDMNRLERTEWVTLAELTDDHLSALINGLWGSELYQYFFQQEKQYRIDNGNKTETGERTAHR